MHQNESPDARRARLARERDAAARRRPTRDEAQVEEDGILLGGSGERAQSGRNSGRGADETRRAEA